LEVTLQVLQVLAVLLFEDVAVSLDVLQEFGVSDLGLVIAIDIFDLLVTSSVHFRVRLAIASHFRLLVAVNVHKHIVVIAIIVFV